MSQIDINKRIKNFLDAAISNIGIRDFDRAIEELEAALILDRENPEVIYNLAVCYAKKGLFKTAIKYFENLTNLTLTFVDILTVRKMLAYLYLMDDDNLKAKNTITDAMKISQNDTTLLNMLGYIMEKDSKLLEAIKIYKKIIEIDNSNFNAYNSLAYITALADGNLNEALLFAKKALSSNPDNPAYLDTIGYVYYKKNQTDIAKNYLKKALEKSPDSETIKEHINELLNI